MDMIERTFWFVERFAPCTCRLGWCLGAWAMERAVERGKRT